MKRVSQAPWFIVLCVSISEILYCICLVSLSARVARGVSLSLGSRARACQERRALVSLPAPAGPRAGAQWPTNYSIFTEGCQLAGQ